MMEFEASMKRASRKAGTQQNPGAVYELLLVIDDGQVAAQLMTISEHVRVRLVEYQPPLQAASDEPTPMEREIERTTTVDGDSTVLETRALDVSSQERMPDVETGDDEDRANGRGREPVVLAPRNGRRRGTVARDDGP